MGPHWMISHISFFGLPKPSILSKLGLMFSQSSSRVISVQIVRVALQLYPASSSPCFPSEMLLGMFPIAACSQSSWNQPSWQPFSLFLSTEPPSSLAFPAPTALSSLAALSGNWVATDGPTTMRDELAASPVTLASVVSPLSWHHRKENKVKFFPFCLSFFFFSTFHRHFFFPWCCLSPCGPVVLTCTSSPHSGQHAIVETSYLGPLFF